MVAISKTRNELVIAACEILVSGAGNAPETEDYAYVNGRVDELFADVAAARVVEVSNEDQIPIEWFSSLVNGLVELCSLKFGRATSQAAYEMAIMPLKKKTMSGPTYEVLSAEYF